MNLAIVSDEVSLNFAHAVKICRNLGIYTYELRRIGNQRIPFISKEQIYDIKNIVDEKGISISALSPGIFKMPLKSEMLDFHKGCIMDKTMKVAELLNVDKIIIFSIQRSLKDEQSDYQQVIDNIGQVANKARSNGFEVMLENEPGWWADTSENIYKILNDLKSTGLKLNWDVGNLFNAGEEDYRKGYELLKDYIINIHVKDVKKSENGNIYVPVGEGDIDWIGQIKQLKKDGYFGNIVVETHCNRNLDASILSINYIKSIMF